MSWEYQTGKRRGVTMSKTRATAAGIICTAFLVTALSAFGATVNQPATFNASGLEAWFGIDVNSGGNVSLSNPGDRLQLTFPSQSSGVPPQWYDMRANATSSGGKFVGNFRDAGATCILFSLYCENYVPDLAWVCFHSSVSGNRWFYPLSGLSVGWQNIEVPLDFSQGWMLDYGPTAEQFETDLQSVDWVSVRLQRNSSLAQQKFGVDNFVLANPLYDRDGDGSNDYNEERAGTDPNDPNSVFQLTYSTENTTSGIVVTWPSKAGATYDVWRTSNLVEGFGSVPIATVIAIDSITSYEDATAAGAGPFFFAVTLR